jgi:hypothetical protein
MKIFILPIMALFIYGCSPKVIINAERKLQETKQYEGFVIIGLKDTFNTNIGQYLGDIQIKDSGFTLDCSYEIVSKLAEAEARKLGGNILKIIAHKLPNPGFSTCHRITGKVYKVADVSKYEKKIVWNENRKLKQIDFKGSIKNRPFEAATSSYFGYEYSGRVFQGKVKFIVTTQFDCERSYFKGTYQVDTVLAHEQGHFDMTELYARKFFKKISEDIKNMKDLESNVSIIYDDFTKELQIEQDRYDSDIYPNQAKQAIWLKKLQEDLKKYEQYSNKQIFIPIL